MCVSGAAWRAYVREGRASGVCTIKRGVGDVGCEMQVNEESHSARARFQPASEYHRKANGF